MQTQQSPTQTETRPGNDDTQASVARVAELIDRARAAQQRYADYDQQGVDEVVTAVAWTLLEPKTNQRLSEQAVADTGLGNVKDKIIKNHRKTLGLLRDLKRAKSVGVIAEYPEKGLIEIARPVGVVAAVAPSTRFGVLPTGMLRARASSRLM